MTNSSPTPDPNSSNRTPLGFDDFIGILVAFSAIGGIIWWSLSRNPQALNLDRILSSSDRNSTPLLVPSPQATSESQPTPTLEPSDQSYRCTYSSPTNPSPSSGSSCTKCNAKGKNSNYFYRCSPRLLGASLH